MGILIYLQFIFIIKIDIKNIISFKFLKQI